MFHLFGNMSMNNWQIKTKCICLFFSTTKSDTIVRDITYILAMIHLMLCEFNSYIFKEISFNAEIAHLTHGYPHKNRKLIRNNVHNKHRDSPEYIKCANRNTMTGLTINE